MTLLWGHVTIFSQVPAQKLDEFRVNSVHGGAPGQFVPFSCGSNRGKQI